jgi:hypothetical protein
MERAIQTRLNRESLPMAAWPGTVSVAARISALREPPSGPLLLRIFEEQIVHFAADEGRPVLVCADALETGDLARLVARDAGHLGSSARL